MSNPGSDLRNGIRHAVARLRSRPAVLALAVVAVGVELPTISNALDDPSRTTAEPRMPITDRGDFALPSTWQKNSDLVGKKVVNGANESLGKIENIVVDANSGRILYGVLSYGGVASIGDKLFAVRR